MVNLGYCYEWMGQSDEARRVFTRAVQVIKPTPETVVGPDANGTPTILALAYAGLGEKEKALAQAQQALKDYSSDAVKPAAEIVLAQIQAHFGDLDPAITALPHLLEIPAGLTVATLKFDPMWDPMRKDPRFQKLLSGQRPVRSELAQLLRRAKTAQRLQGRSRVCSSCLAINSGCVDFPSGFRRAAVGDEDIYHRHHLRFSGGADSFLGV